DDRHYYPFYAKCVELGILLSIHTSANWTSVAVNDLGHPRHLDPVARDFPELRIIMSHGGYPWVLEACLLAWKYENVYLELAAHRGEERARLVLHARQMLAADERLGVDLVHVLGARGPGGEPAARGGGGHVNTK